MDKKHMQLGEPIGTAAHRLRKMVLFALLQEFGRNVCFRCDGSIDNINELSMEHKVAWLDSEEPRRLFFDVRNIAFSHISCNVGAARRPNKLPPDERRRRDLEQMRTAQRKLYTPERRREKYQKHGY